MKRSFSLACTLMLLVSSAGAQADSSAWKTYTVKGEQFSVALPAPPTLDLTRFWIDASTRRLEMTLASYAEGVVYIVHIAENVSPRRSLDTFIKERGSSARPLNRKTESKLTLDGATGKSYSFDRIAGGVQFYSKDQRLFQFAAYGAPQGDARLSKFFSSISLVDNKDSIQMSDQAPGPITSSDTPEQILTPKEVDKSFQVIMNSHPEYTEEARQNQISGTVVLKCVLSANGHITGITVVSGLPHGLTERAIAAARRLKFIPAMKDGRYVSISTQLVYNFKLF